MPRTKKPSPPAAPPGADEKALRDLLASLEGKPAEANRQAAILEVLAEPVARRAAKYMQLLEVIHPNVVRVKPRQAEESPPPAVDSWDGTIDTEVAVREFLVNRIGKSGLEHLDDFMARLKSRLPCCFRSHPKCNDIIADEWVECSGMSASEVESLIVHIAELVRGAWVAGHRVGSGKDIEDRRNAERNARIHFAIHDAYAATKGKAMTQGARIAAVMKATGASRSTVYRVLDLGK